MKRWLALYRSSVGKKAIAAVTGAVLLGFLFLHVAGNLKAFLGDAAPGVPDIDVYGRFLRTMGEPLLPAGSALWATRIVLVTALVLHLTCVVQLSLRNHRARPLGYRQAHYLQATRPARWMLVTGTLILGFLVVHILQFTTGNIDASRFVEGAVYANLHGAFASGPWIFLYLGAMTVVALHLHHGAWSLFQSLGIDNPDRNRGLRLLAAGVAVGLFLAFTSVPVAFATGILGPPSSNQASLPAAEGN